MSKAKDKRYALRLLKEKRAGTRDRSMESISSMSGYSVRQLQRMNSELDEEKDTEEIVKHGNAGRTPVNIALESEYEYLRIFKEPYPTITIAQFRDFFLEDVINNPSKADDVIRYHLKPRSESWFRSLFIKEGWRSPKQHRNSKREQRQHLLRQPSARKGALVQIDGTPHDWFNDGRMYCLHLAVDDATTEILSGWFTPHECQFGYCMMMKIMFKNHGIPMSLYSDRHTILCNVKDGSATQFSQMMAEAGIEMIYALSPQAKGRVERANETVQLRLPNDIIRFRNKGVKLDDYDDLNIWFNDFYIPYINAKMSFLPLDLNDAFTEIEDDFDYSKIFSLKTERIINNDTFSLGGWYYSVTEETGKLLHIRDGVKVDVRIDVFDQTVSIIYHGSRYRCRKLQERRIRNKALISDQKDLEKWMKEGKKAY